ncbi:MAG: cupin domain-containing protein [Actinobacteria bacterium]|nr:cupin domain-containing protein [Actinomycetota bacterium]
MDKFVTHEDQLEWVPADFPRAQMKVLYMDPRGGGQILLVRFEPHCEMPAHGHAASDEAAYVLEGELRQPAEVGEDEVFRKGHFVFLPAGLRHGPFIAGEEGCTIISVFYGPLR